MWGDSSFDLWPPNLISSPLNLIGCNMPDVTKFLTGIRDILNSQNWHSHTCTQTTNLKTERLRPQLSLVQKHKNHLLLHKYFYIFPPQIGGFFSSCTCISLSMCFSMKDVTTSTLLCDENLLPMDIYSFPSHFCLMKTIKIAQPLVATEECRGNEWMMHELMKEHCHLNPLL